MLETERKTQARSGQFAPKREIQQEFMWSLAKTAAPRAEDALCSPACCWHLCASHAKDEPCQKGLQIHQVPFSSVLKPAGEPACTGATLEARQRQLTLPAAARGSPAAAWSPCVHIIKSSSSGAGKTESKIKARLAVFQVARARLSHSPASPGVLGSE